MYDSNNSQIGVNDDGGSALNFRLSCYLTANQTYYIKIETHSSNIGYFNMVIVDKAFIESIEIDDLYVELTKGQSTRLTATVSPSYATNQTLRWDTSDSNIVSVNANTGEITAVNGGTAMVCAYSQDGSGKSSCCEVVVKVPVELVTVNTETKLMHVGESDSLSVTVLPEDASDKLVYWTSSNNDVAVISSATGRVTAKGVGTANIYATAEDGSGKQGVCVLTVEPPIAVQGIEFCSESYTINKGETKYLSYNIFPSIATNKAVTWSSSNTRVATVNSISGLVTAVDTGDVIITAITEDGNHMASVNIRVVIESVTIKPDGNFNKVVFESSGKVWYCINHDMIYDEENIRSNGLFDRAERNMYVNPNKEDVENADYTVRTYTYNELKLLYAIDPYGVARYVQEYADYLSGGLQTTLHHLLQVQ